MNAPRKLTLHIILAWWLLCWLLALGLALVPTSIAYADNCKTEPWNLADCLRTPGYRETYVELLLAAGVLPTTISQILSEASKTSLNDQDLNRFITDQILPGFRKAFKKAVASFIGGNMASKSADRLISLDKDSNSSPPPPPQGKIPYEEDAFRQTKPPPAKEIPVEQIYDYSPGAIVSGKAARDFLTGTGALDKVARLHKGDTWDDKIKSMEGKPGKITITDFSIEWNSDGTPNLDNLVFVIPDNAPPDLTGPSDRVPEEPEKEDVSKTDEEEKKEPEPPVTKKTPVVPVDPVEIKLRDDVNREFDEAKRKKKAVEDAEKRMKEQERKAQQYGIKYRTEVDQRLSDGAIEIGDTVRMVVEDIISVMQVSGGIITEDTYKEVLKKYLESVKDDALKASDKDLLKAYGRDVIKNSLKEMYRNRIAEEHSPDFLTQQQRQESRDRILQEPIGLRIPPGGATKEWFNKAIGRKWPVISRIYDYGEQIYSTYSEYSDHGSNIENYLQKKGEHFTNYLDERSKYVDARGDYKVAEDRLARARKAIYDYRQNRSTQGQK